MTVLRSGMGLGFASFLSNVSAGTANIFAYAILGVVVLIYRRKSRRENPASPSGHS